MTKSRSRRNFDLPRNTMLCRRLLLLLAVSVVSVPCVVLANAESMVSERHRHRHTRRQEELIIGDDNSDARIRYNPCSLCQGLTILTDKIVDPENNTCADASTYFEDPSFQKMGFGAEVLARNVTHYNAGGCRSDYEFNRLFLLCCRASVPTYECETNVQNYILGTSSDYNTVVPPIVGPEPDQKLNVSVGLQYEALEHIEVEQGTATIFVSLVITWKDQRLQWDVNDNDTCTNSVNAWTGQSDESTSIWVPDFDLLNQIEGIQHMPNTKAVVYSDGTVQWLLSGGLMTFCAFRGLGQIPFDILGCQMLFAPSIHSDNINYVLERPDHLFVGFFDVTYNEWTPVPEHFEQGYAFGGGSIYYNIYFKRATGHYVANIVIPTVILTYLSFFTFLLDMRVGERLGFGMALCLVVVAQQIVTTGMTPVSDQRLWLDKFVSWSFYWVLVGVIQSVLVGFLFFLREDKMAKAERANTESKRKEADEEELQLLATEEPKPIADAVKYPDKENVTKENYRKYYVAWNKFVYTFSFRKMDMVALLISMVSYTVFCITMIMMGSGDSTFWLPNEPEWVDETSIAYSQGPYTNGDPNNR